VRRVFRAITVVFLGSCLEGALVAQAIAPRTFRAVAGEARTAALNDGVPPLTAVTSARTTPPLEFPIRVLTTEPTGMKLVIPPATPPGDYTVEIEGRGPEGRSISTTLRVKVDAVTFSPEAVAARPPVILLNGFQLVCGDTASTLTASVDTFGQLASLLQTDGVGVAYFNNCTYGDVSIEQLAGQLNNYLAGLKYTDGTPIPQVDLVVHSMGGLIARAYLAGKGQSSGSFSPPVNHKIRKLIAIATPHFGSFQAGYIGTQESEMVPGNQFLWDLATWNQGQDDLRGVDALAIIGNAGTYGTTNNASDGVVSLTSGSLGFVEPDQRTRIVPYCHITPGFLTGLGMSCANNHGIADIDSASHLSAQIVRSFLADTPAWQSVGYTPSADPFLSRYGGALLALKGTNDVYFADLTGVTFDNAAGSLVAGPSKAVASLYYSEFIAGGQHSFSMTHSSAQVTTGTGTPVAGSGRALLFKFGPVISAVRSATGGLPGLTVASGSNVTVYGSGFSGTGTQLTANGAALTTSSLSDQQITAFLPAGYNGLVQLKVSNASGQHTVNIMTAAAAPPPAISLSAGQASFSYTSGGSAPASQTVNITNSGGGTLTWSASSGSSWLTVSPNSGVGSGTLTLAIDPAGLSAQTYNGAITLTASGATNSPQTISVALTVNAAPQPSLSLSASQASFSFSLGGGTPASQTVNITNAGAGTLAWSVASGSSWLTVSPNSGTGSGTLTLWINPAGLTAQTYNGAITVTAPGAANSPRTVSVTLTVNAAPQPSLSLSTGQASFSFTLGAGTPTSQTVNITNAGAGSLAWSAASGSSWLTVSPNSGTGSGTLTLGINPAGLTAQTYTGAITVTAPGAANSPRIVSVTLTVNAAPASPVVVSAVVNAASWSGGTVAPGELVVIGGTMLGPSTGVSGTVDPSTGKMVSQLAGTTVMFNGIAAPLLYTSATQVNAIVPYEAAGCTQATLQVQYQGILSPATTLPCTTAAPGIFTFNASGAGPAAAANQDGTFNGPSSPAAKGSYVTLYFTGGGQTNPAGVTGSITGTSTLKWLTQNTIVMVGGVAATVAFDGAAPTFVDGVLQLNVQLSGDTPTGSALPVVIKVGNASSPATATLAVQ
jgi:uncharacterized protein (TIGR03437 family)